MTNSCDAPLIRLSWVLSLIYFDIWVSEIFIYPLYRVLNISSLSFNQKMEGKQKAHKYLNSNFQTHAKYFLHLQTIPTLPKRK